MQLPPPVLPLKCPTTQHPTNMFYADDHDPQPHGKDNRFQHDPYDPDDTYQCDPNQEGPDHHSPTDPTNITHDQQPKQSNQYNNYDNFSMADY